MTTTDIEQSRGADSHFLNSTIHNISWRDLTVTTKGSNNEGTKTIMSNVEGIVEAGECCAIMGPSGCGKTTLLNVLSRRPMHGVVIEGKVSVNGQETSDAVFRCVTSLVEDHDTFTASLTARETLEFASRLASSRHQREELRGRIDTLVQVFGLADQADAFIGKVLSNGQKRRLAVARRLVTGPKILFLDEPTSGLDSVASFYVISYLRKIAKLNNLIIICSIHQPSTSTFDLFDKLLLLSGGKSHYFGPTTDIIEFYQNCGVTVPQRANPAELILELVNIDFSDSRPTSSESIAKLQSLWRLSSSRQRILESIFACEGATDGVIVESASRPSLPSHIVTLIHRNFLKAYRDAMAYHLRLLMYTGLGLLMGTIWLRLDRNQDSIQLLVNALIVSCGFMAFMAVTYVPAFIEDYRQYLQEHRNGLYGATAFHISNFLVGIPHLFLFSMMFSVVFYWLSNCQPSAIAFFTWVMWLFFDLLAAEAVVVLAVTIVPNFVGSLVLAALINVLMFGTAGTLVPPGRLNAFYKYGLYYWNFQAYIFQGMMVTQFDHQTYDCGGNCECRYAPTPTDRCHIAGGQVLHEFGIQTGVQGRNIVIVILIILGYRTASWAVLRFKQ